MAQFVIEKLKSDLSSLACKLEAYQLAPIVDFIDGDFIFIIILEIIEHFDCYTCGQLFENRPTAGVLILWNH